MTRARPGAVVLWAAIWLIGLIVAAFATVPFIAPYMDEIQAAQGDMRSLSAGAQQALNTAGYAAAPVLAAIQAILAPAVYRAVLRPEQRSLGSVRIGADEARVFITVLGLSLVSIVVQLGGEAAEQVAMSQVGVIGALAVATVVFLFSVWFAVRSSLISPATFTERRISVKAPFALSGRHFWALLGMLVISIVMAVLVILLLMLVGWPLYSVMIQAGTAPTALAGIAAIGMILLMPLAAALSCTIIWAPFAAAYRDLRSET